MALPWMAMGIGALMGGLGAKQRGGNFLKGALQGAALGGIGGMMGSKLTQGKYLGSFGGSQGMFGMGTKMIPNFLAMSGIGMGTEMFGQQEANKLRMQQTRKWLDEEEERRMARLSKIAGYDVGDPQYFLTPNKYFATSAEGGMISRPGYYNGGISSLEDDPANAVNIQELQMDPGTMGPGGLTEEFDYMDEASLNPEIQKLYKAFLIANQTTEEEVPVEMFMQLMQQQGGQQGGQQLGQQGPMMAAEGGQVNRPGYDWGGFLGGAKNLWGDASQMARDLTPGGGDSSFYGGRSPIEEQRGYASPRQEFYGGRSPIEEEHGSRQEWENMIMKSKWEDYKNSMGMQEDEEGRLIQTMGAAQGGSVMGKDEYDEELNRPKMFLGGILGLGALLGLGKILGGRKKDVKAKIKEKPILKPFPKPPGMKPPGVPWDPDEEDGGIFPMPSPHLPDFPRIMPLDPIFQHVPFGRAKGGRVKMVGGGIGDLDMTNGGASLGPGTGTSDDIPAMLSDGEFVVTANAVQNLGGGDRMLGAQRMYRMMNQLDPNSQTPAEMSGVGYA